MAVHWAIVASMLSGVGSLAGAIAIAWAAHRASNTYDQWQRQTLSARRMEQAERILTAAYDAVRKLQLIRRDPTTTREAIIAEQTLEREKESETPSLEKEQKRIQTIVRRIRVDEASVLVRELELCIPMANALLTHSVGYEIEHIIEQFRYFEALLDLSMEEIELDAEQALVLWPELHERCPMDYALAKSLAEIEASCLPLLRGYVT